MNNIKNIKENEIKYQKENINNLYRKLHQLLDKIITEIPTIEITPNQYCTHKCVEAFHAFMEGKYNLDEYELFEKHAFKKIDKEAVLLGLLSFYSSDLNDSKTKLENLEIELEDIN